MHLQLREGIRTAFHAGTGFLRANYKTSAYFTLDIVKAHFVKITFSALLAFFIFYSINVFKTSLKKPNNINAVVKKSVLPVFVNSLPEDHYAQRIGQNFQERGINFFPHEVTKRKCNDYY